MMSTWNGIFVRFPLIVLLPLVFHCSKDNPVQVTLGTDPEVSDLIAPAFVYNASQRAHLVSVQVQDPQGIADIEDVSYEIRKDGAGAILSQGNLFDDGFHGDVIAEDGVFSNTVTGSFAAGETGDFAITVFARDKAGNRSENESAPLVVLNGTENLAPVLLSVNIPATVPVDSSHQFVITARVDDPEGLANIARVTYQFFPPASSQPSISDTLTDSGTQADLIAGDGIYSAGLNSNLVARLLDHSIRIQAEDRAGNVSAPVVRFIRGRPAISQAPSISGVSLPRMINASANNEVFMSADVADPEGLSDVDTVSFQAFLPDGNEASFSPVQMFDDGDAQGSGDMVADDGTFSVRFTIEESASAPLDYRLVFLAKDRSGMLSPPLIRPFVVGFDDNPYISRLVTLDSVRANETQRTPILITLDVRDPQTLSDIALVQFRSFLPNGTEAAESPFELLDNGNAGNGDNMKDDGIYSIIVFLPPADQVLKGDFLWRFEARDAQGNVSNSIGHILKVL